MTSRGEDATSELQDFQLGSSWIPITPSKPGPRDQQPVCTKWQENHPVLSAPVNLDHLVTQANVCEPTTLAEHFLQEFDIWQAGGAAKTHVNNKFSLSEPDQWTNISFKGLLALAESKSNTAAIGNAHAYHDFATSSSFGPDYCMSFGNSAGQDQGSLLGANLNAEFEVPNFVTDENSISSRHFFDLNSPATMTAAAASQFEPITPEKTNRAEYRQESILKDLSIDEVPAEKGKDLTENGVVTLHKDKVKSQLVNDQLCGATSTQLQENHKPDNEGAEEANLSKTPQQKTRRRKHRPKVIIEGQKKSTPKSSAKKPTSPQEPGVKRKYVRKKGVNNLIGGGTNGTDSVNKTPNSTVTPEGKRKYTRRRKIDTPEDEMDNGTTGTTDIKATPYTQRSCRRSLNFDLDGPERDGRATYCPSSSCNKESQEMEVMLRRNDMVPSQQPSEKPTPSINMDTLKNNHMFTDQIMCSRGKCQIVFSDVTHDKEVNNVQVTPKSRSDSITCLTPEKQDQGLKRKSINTPFEAELSNRNETGAYYNSMQAYLPMFLQNADKNNGTPGLHFPPIHKKKRIENVYSAVTSSIQIRDSSTRLFTPPTNQGYCAGLGQQNNNFLTNNHATYGTQDGRQLFRDLLALGPAQRIKKRRSKGPTCQWDLASLVEQLPASRGYTATASRIKQHTKILQEPPTCRGTRVSDTCSTILTKKRSHRSMVINSTVQNLYNNHKFSTTSIGPPLALTWDIASPVDSITEQLNQLDLNAKSSLASERKCSALMAHRGYYQEQHAIIQFQNPAAIVPFNSSFDKVRRRRPRPKVDLDHETDRVWRLLLENINNEGIDGTDEEKAKWWEEERRVFRGRTDSFIARMHLVQGDRRFSPWKGSVVDSVVGVFLTQNVADHLSSSAFMSMVSRYPSKSNPHPAELHEEKFTTEINEPDLDSVRTFRLSKEILTKTAGGKDTNMIQEFKDDSIREVNSVMPSGNTFDVFIPEENLRGQSTDVSIHGPATSSEIATNKSISLTDDGRDTEDTLSSQNSTNSPIAQTTERSDSYFLSTSEDEPTVGVNPNRITKSTSSAKILQMAGTVSLGAYVKSSKHKTTDENHQVQSESSASNLQIEDHLVNPTFPAKTIASCSQSTLCCVTNSGTQTTEFDLSEKKKKASDTSSNEERFAAEASDLSSESASGITFLETTSVSFEEARKTLGPNTHYSMNTAIEVNGDVVGNQTGQAPAKNEMQGISKCPNSNKNGLYDHASNTVNEPKAKGGRPRKEKENQVDWDHFRKQTLLDGRKRTRPANTLDSVDWEAVRCTDVSEIAETIKERGMNNVLAQRIQDFLNRIVRDHGSIDLEWLRDIPPDKAKEYLLSIRGLGLKSVECVRLLTLHHLAFPVDTNVGRIAVRLGWVPLQPLPESLQLHLLELYPVLESIQKYLWPRLCKLDQKTLYELHYQMITFGKVFCTKSKPNCNACPLRAECRHFASAFASARLALPAPQEKSIVSATENRKYDQNPVRNMNALQLPSPPFVNATENRKYYQNPVRNMNALQLPSPPSNETDRKSGVVNSGPIIEEPPSPEPIIEVPATPEPDHIQVPECDIEDAFDEDLDEIPTIQLNIEEFTHNLQTIMQQNTELQGGDMSKALVALASEAASIPVPKLKNVNHLRTEHQVYELPDSHPLLEGMDKREPDDPCPYLLAIWTPGETMDSIEPPERQCSSQGFDKLCSDETCSSCNSIREANSQTVRGTILIPCRTAMRGSFPLNGTYFQVNEVFSDHESSLSPIYVPREWLWNLPRRTVYFGTSIPSIFKGLSTEGIQYCFWRGFVCVRGFDRRMRAPRPLIARLHFPASRLPRGKGKGKIDESNA